MNIRNKSKTGLSFTVIVVMLIISTIYSKAQEWTQFLGPDRNHTSQQKGLLRSWPESGPEVLWSVNVCMDMDGKIMWKTRRNPNFYRGSMLLADGLILATDGLQTLYLIEPDPTEFKPISKSND